MKDFEQRVELVFFRLITVVVITRLNQVFNNTEAPADDGWHSLSTLPCNGSEQLPLRRDYLSERPERWISGQSL